jgi:asparagine synthase (glutamine-hydrolysing)
MYVTAKDALDIIPRLPAIYDEPFADSSQIPTVLVASLARQHVTVALSGDGGDELFGGYSRYASTMALWNRIRRMPAGVRRAAAGAVTSIGVQHWDTALQPLGMIARGYNGDRLHTLAHLFGASDASMLYSHLLSSWRNPSSLVRGMGHSRVAVDAFPVSAGHPNGLLAHMMLHDQQTYLPGDIMVKVDRAAMAASLETRAPLLDHRVAEFAWSLQQDQWMRGGKGKWILRSLLDRYVPRTLVDRPKQGFGIPYGEWLRGPLREWADDLLSPQALEADDLFDSAPIVRRWHQHTAGTNNWAPSLWSVLMLQAWRRHAS